MTRILVTLVLSLAVCSATASAQEQPAYEGLGATPGATAGSLDPDPSFRPFSASAMLYIPWYWGFGIGVVGRFEIPILPQGFIAGMNDQLSIEPSMSFAYSDYGLSSVDYSFTHLTPAVYATWSFFMQPNFRLYGGLGLGYSIAFYSSDLSGVSLSYFFWDAVFGLFYNFSSVLALRAELGYQGPKVGLTVLF
jgi:hypothetical protein